MVEVQTHNGQGRAGSHLQESKARSVALRPPGFRFVQCALVAIVAVFAAMVLGVGVLAWEAEMDVTVEGHGVVEPSKRIEVKAAIAGRIADVGVREGDLVEAGAIVAEIDATEWRAELNQVERDLEVNAARSEETRIRIQDDRELLESERLRADRHRETAALQLEQTRREYKLHYDHYQPTVRKRREPVESLLPLRIRQSVLDAANVEVTRVEQQLRGLRARQLELEALRIQKRKLEQQRFLILHRINRATMRASADGTVVTRDVERKAGSLVQLGETVVELAQLGDWKARVIVPEADIPKVSVGQSVRLYVEAFPHIEYKVFRGKVVRVARKTEVEAWKSAALDGYPVEISIANPIARDGERTYGLSFGMRVTAKIVVERGRVAAVAWRNILKKLGRAVPREYRLRQAG